MGRKRYATEEERKAARKAAKREQNALYRAANPEKERERQARYRKNNREKKRETCTRWNMANRLAKALISAKSRSLKLGREFSITVEELQARYDRGVCERSGVPFDLSPGARSWRTPSLDRIDSSKGYTLDNVQLVIWAYNSAKNNDTDEDVEMLAAFLMRRAREKRFGHSQPTRPDSDPDTSNVPHRSETPPAAEMVQLEFPFLHQSR